MRRSVKPSLQVTAPGTRRKPNTWLSVTEAARLLGVSRQTVYARANRGELTTREVADRTVVSRLSVEAALLDASAAA